MLPKTGTIFGYPSIRHTCMMLENPIKKFPFWDVEEHIYYSHVHVHVHKHSV